MPRRSSNDRVGDWVGNFNIQTTLSESFPTSRVSKIGDSTIWNLALQAHFGEVFCPEVEMNYTYFPNGPRAGKTQIAITPNLIVGSIPTNQRLGLNIGLGYQLWRRRTCRALTGTGSVGASEFCSGAGLWQIRATLILVREPY